MSFSITGSAGLFGEVFGATLCRTDDEGVACIGPRGTVDLELPLHKLGPDISQAVHAVTFTPPDHFDVLQ